MDKIEYNNRLDQINTLVEAHDIQGAVEIAETIDWRRVKSLRTLCMIADIYEADKKYEESKDILLLAYNRSSVGKAILYRLVEVCIKLDQMDDAVEYYTEYAKNASGDSAKYLLKYKIYRARRSPLEEQAEVLEKYKEKEYTERWAYELARLYDRMGMKDKCIEECDDLILWFSEGKYVAKAMELKKKYEPLSLMQQQSYNGMKETTAPIETLRMEAEEAGDDGLESFDSEDSSVLEDEESIRERTARMTTVAKAAIAKRSEELEASRNTEELQDKLANSFRDVLSGFNRVKENIISPATPDLEEEEKEEDNLNVEEYTDAKDLEPEDMTAKFSTAEIPVEKILEKMVAEVDGEEAKEEATSEVSAEDQKEDPEIDKIISEMNEAMATQVEKIQESQDVPAKEDEAQSEEVSSDEASSEEGNGEESEEVSSEDKIMQESDESDEEKRTRVLNATKSDKMTDDQKKIFSYFAKVPGMDQQVLEALHGAYQHIGERTSKGGNIVVMGSKGSGKTKLFEGIVKAICQDLGIEAAKVAKISATALNEKEPAEVIAKMSGGFLLVEEAGSLSAETIEKMSKALGFRTDRMILVIEDEKDKMRKLLADHKEFADKFKTTISIPVFTNDELVTFARTYARENGYKVEEMGVLALYDLIGSKQSERDPITIDGVREIMDKAIANTQKVTRKFGRKLAVRDVDEEGRILIHEKDFY